MLVQNPNLSVLVAIDLTSRGIAIKKLPLPYVINYELPRSSKDFVHRVGRIGRAWAERLLINFVIKREMRSSKSSPRN